MLKIFNNNYEEIGSLNKNLVLNTQGKVKIRFNKKFIDLLDNNGNINVKIPNVIEEKDDVNKISSNGIYIVNGVLYVYCNKTLIKVTAQVIDDVEEIDEKSNELSGVEFVAPEEGEVVYPHYSTELNEQLCSIEDETNIIDVVPTIRWINQKLEELSAQINENKGNIEDIQGEYEEITENIKSSETWNDFRQIYNPPTEGGS